MATPIKRKALDLDDLTEKIGGCARANTIPRHLLPKFTYIKERYPSKKQFIINTIGIFNRFVFRIDHTV